MEPDLLTYVVFSDLIQRLLRDDVEDVAIVAAERVITDGLTVHKPISQIHRLAQFALKDAGIIGKVVDDSCPVSDIMADVLGSDIKTYKWKRFFTVHYDQILRHMIRWRGYVETDATAWVNLTDTINDIVLDELHRLDASLGGYQFGNIGSVLQPTGRLARKYPFFFSAVQRIHNLRYKSHLSHPIEARTGLATGHIRYQKIKPCLPLLREGFLEIGSNCLI